MPGSSRRARRAGARARIRARVRPQFLRSDVGRQGLRAGQLRDGRSRARKGDTASPADMIRGDFRKRAIAAARGRSRGRAHRCSPAPDWQPDHHEPASGKPEREEADARKPSGHEPCQMLARTCLWTGIEAAALSKNPAPVLYGRLDMKCVGAAAVCVWTAGDSGRTGRRSR